MPTPPPGTWKWIAQAAWWLANLIGLDKIVNWVLGRINGAVQRQGSRRKAIKAAKGVDGGWAPVLINSDLHYVVFSNRGEALQSFPEVENLGAKVEHFSREQVRTPDDVPSKRFRRWSRDRLRLAFETIRRRADETDGISPRDGRRLFTELVGGLDSLLESLVASPAAPLGDHESVPAGAGVYLFSETGSPLYVGQSRKLRNRLKQHTSPNSKENQAPFAYNIALKLAAERELELSGTRKANAANPEFAELFRAARARVAQMDVQFIELEGPIERTMLEIYTTQALGLEEFNTFETH